MTGQICILGASATRVDRWQAKTDRTDLDLLDEAVRGALDDAGVGRDAVEALSFSTPGPGTVQRLFSSYATARLGFRTAGKVVESGTGGWTGGLAFDAAAAEIARGRASVALALGVWMETGIDTATAMDGAIRSTGDVGYQTPSGATPLSWYAMDAQRWLHDTGGTRADLAAIAVKNRRHAALNPLAQFTGDLTIPEVLAARPVVAPMGLYDVSPRGDGAACLVLCDRATADASGRPYTVLTGSAFAHDGAFQTSGDPGPVMPYGSLARAAALALGQSGLGMGDMDLFELYAPMTVVEAISVETLGLAAPGQGGRAAADGATALGGLHPVNVSGGLLSRGHPTGVTALYDLMELHLQLTGVAGARQVRDARHALHACETGKYNGAMVNILASGGTT
ncbi:thiolase family protein [Ruegeria pomeroyi]|nr:thiolase family protein [Ruegeria pomeroyi]